MDSFEWNKIAGWTLAAAATTLGLVLVTGEVYHTEPLEKSAYVVEGVEEVAAAGPAKEAEKPIAFYLASASPEKGAAVFKKCGACHNNEKGGAAGIGPNLYGIVGDSHARMPGFAYSEALAGKKGTPWSWDELSQWLANPKAYLPGNKMAFAGIGKPEDRAAVLAYLNSKSDRPLPLPPVPADTPAAEAPADASGATPPGTPTSAQPAPAVAKAPDVATTSTTDAAAQPQKNVGGPGAAESAGTSATEK